jgi:hypothetical protein
VDVNTFPTYLSFLFLFLELTNASSLIPFNFSISSQVSKMSQKTDITLYFLQASRSIRIAWLLEELGLEYKSVFFPRENNKAPSDFKSQSGNTLGKAPCIKDGGLTIGESGAITEWVIASPSECDNGIHETGKGRTRLTTEQISH